MDFLADIKRVKLNAGALELTPHRASAPSYAAELLTEVILYGGSFRVGERQVLRSQRLLNKEAIASWNASTPVAGVEVQFRAQYGTRWSKWYC